MQIIKIIFLLFSFVQAGSARSDFSWIDTPMKHLDLFWGELKLPLYVYEQMDTG